MSTQTNVVFILIDALRARNLSCYGNSIKTSPNIDGYAKSGLLFKNCFSCTNATDPSLTSIFSGKHPFSHGIINHGVRVTKEQLKTLYATRTIFLPEVLKGYDYKTLAVGYNGRWHTRGYDVYYKEKRYRKGIVTIKHDDYSQTKHLTSKAIELIDEYSNRPFFLFIHYRSTHMPYMPPMEYIERAYVKHKNNKILTDIPGELGDNANCDRFLYFSNIKDTNLAIACYNGEIAFTDEQIGRIREKLESAGLTDTTTVIITSDHGESLDEHGVYFDHHCLYDVNIHVPLILYNPSIFGSGTFDPQVQHIDLFHTLLHSLDIYHKKYRTDGIDMFDMLEKGEGRDSIYTMESYAQKKIALRTADYKFIKAQRIEEAHCRLCDVIHGGGANELYNLKEDPRENHNIAEEQPRLCDTFDEAVTLWANKLMAKRDVDIMKRRQVSMIL